MDHDTEILDSRTQTVGEIRHRPQQYTFEFGEAVHQKHTRNGTGVCRANAGQKKSYLCDGAQHLASSSSRNPRSSCLSAEPLVRMDRLFSMSGEK
ncbi:hypothetical protein STEG23_030081, partial [Scotinomys teguina]